MSQHNTRKKIPETCRFWKESKCQKGEYQCSFVHGYICANDGRCWRENCNRIHFNQKKNMPPREHCAKPHMNYQRSGHRPRYRRSHSRSQSPPRHRKMPQRGRSPPHRRSRSRSPTYHTRVYSPYQRRSRSPSPYRGISRSPSPMRHCTRSRSRSGSWHHSKSRSASRSRSKNHSPGRIRSRSSSPVGPRSKSCSLAKLRSKSRSPSRSLIRSLSPKPSKRSSSSSSNSSSKSSSSSKTRLKSRAGSDGHYQSSSPSSLKDKSLQPVCSESRTPVAGISEGGEATSHRNKGNVGRKMKLDLENIYADLECETNPVSAASEVLDKEAAEKKAISKLQAHIARDFMNPETQKLMEKVLSSTKEKILKPKLPEENKSKKEFFLDEVGDDIELDLEEVGEEVDDIFTKSINRSMDDSIENTFDRGLSSDRKMDIKAGSNPSPPKSKPFSKPEKPSDQFSDVDFHTDWELKAALETASKSLKKPPQMPPPNKLADGSKIGNTSLWTPALARHQTQAPKNKVGYLPKDSDWEVETPYVGRKTTSEMQRPAAQATTAVNDAPARDEYPTIPFALPLAEPLSTHRISHKPTEIAQEKDEKVTQQKDVLFPSAQSIPCNTISKVPHKIDQTSKSGVSCASQSALAPGMMAPCTADLIRDAANEKELHHSPKEGATAPKKVSEEQTPQKSSESPKRSKRKHRKEKKPKRKKESSEDNDSSEPEDSKEDKKSFQGKEKDTDEIEVLLFKRESLVKRVKLLMEQKDMMSNQREDIINNHKGSKSSLSSILEENSFLTKEIGKQISNISNIIKDINQDIDVKRGNLKQKTAAARGKSESPHVSKETYKTSRYSAEKEKIAKKFVKPMERPETYRASPCQENRTKSPNRKKNKSLSPLPHPRHDPPEAKQKSGDRDSGSRSPKGIRRKRSRSPSSTVSREGPKPVPPPERKQSLSPPRKRSVKSTVEVSKKPAVPHVSQYQTPKSVDSSLQYAPNEAQRTFIRYIDQGMHWCKLCSLFCETAPEYVNHLMTDSHLGRVKNDRKSWLCKAPKEEKEPKPPNAQVLTVPIQGLEFLHSLPSYYCSLCDTFLRDKGEAIRHPESKVHVSKYKVHRAQNPLFESTFLKAKTTAYAKYKIDEERKKMENELSLNEKTSLENKLLKQIKEKFDKENKEERSSESREHSSRSCGSIRVASRGPKHSSDKKASTNHPSHSSGRRHSREEETPPKSGDGSKRKSDSVGQSKTEPQKIQKSESVNSEDDNVNNGDDNEVTNAEGKEEAKYKEEGTKNPDTDRKPASTKLPLIGKMPFLKRKSSMAKSKEQQTTALEEVSKQKKESKEECNLSENLQIPLPSDAKDSNVKKVLEKVKEIKEMQSAAKIEADRIAHSVTLVNSEDKAVKQNVPNSSQLPDAEKCSKSKGKDTCGSDLYDPLEVENEDSSDDVAAATIEALDLLNIPLPGFKITTDIPELSEVPLPPEIGDVYQPEDMEIESTPLMLEEEGIEEGGILEVNNCPPDTVYPSSGIIVHPDIPLPPGDEAPSPSVNINEPPPPGTERIGFSISGKIGITAPTGNILPVLGPQEFTPKDTLPCSYIQRKEDSDIPMPPGTEDEYSTRKISSISLSSGKNKDKADRINKQRHDTGLCSPGGNSLDTSLSFSEKVIKSSSAKHATTPLKNRQKDKNLQCYTERESTPPPPGTEGFSDERDSSIMSKTNKGATKNVGIDILKSVLTPSESKTYMSKQQVLFSPESKYTHSVSLSKMDKFTHSEAEVSENVQADKRNPSSECLTAIKTAGDSKSSFRVKEKSYTSPLKQLDIANTVASYDTDEAKSHTPPPKPDPGSMATLHGSDEAKAGISCTLHKQPDAVTVATSLAVNEKRSNTLPGKRTDASNIATSYGNDEERSITPLPKQSGAGNMATSLGIDEERSNTPSAEESDVGIIATSHDIDEERPNTAPPKQPDEGTLATSSHGIDEEGFNTPPTKEPDSSTITISLDVESSSTPPAEQTDAQIIATSFGIDEESSCTSSADQTDAGIIATSHDSEEESSCTPPAEQTDPGMTVTSHDSEEEGFCTPPPKQPHAAITVTSYDSEEEESCTPPPKQPHASVTATSYDSEEESSCTPSPKQPHAAITATSYDSEEERSFTSPDEQMDAGITATSHDSEEESSCTPSPKQTGTGIVATSLGIDEERSNTPSAEQPCAGFIATLCNSDEESSCTPSLEQPHAGNLSALHDSDEERPNTDSPRHPDAGIIVTSQLEEVLSSPEGDSGFGFLTVKLGEDDRLTRSKIVASDNEEDYRKDSSSQNLTVDSDYQQQDVSYSEENTEDKSCTPPPKQHDIGYADAPHAIIVMAGSKGSQCQDSNKGFMSKESILEEQEGQDSNSLNNLKEVVDHEFCDTVVKRNFTQSDITEKPDNPVSNFGAPIQFIDFHNGFENMDIADLNLPSTSDSVCLKSMDASKIDRIEQSSGAERSESDSIKEVLCDNKTVFAKEIDTDMTVERKSNADKGTSEAPHTKPKFEEELNNESNFKKDQDFGARISEAKAIQETRQSDTDVEECSDSSIDCDSQKTQDNENEFFSLELTLEKESARSTGREVHNESYKEHEVCKETEEVTSEDSLALTDKTYSKSSEENAGSNAKGGKRKKPTIRKTSWKRTAQVQRTGESECTPPRTSASSSSAIHQTLNLVESPRPLRSSRRAAAAAIKAMAKDQGYTPPDSSLSDDDTD